MSKLILVALKDCAVQAFMVPQAVMHKNSMVRALTDGLAKKAEKSPDWVNHPEDFELWEVGSFDDQTGVCSAASPPQMIVRLKDLVVG